MSLQGILSRARLQDRAESPRLAATLTRGVAAGHLCSSRRLDSPKPSAQGIFYPVGWSWHELPGYPLPRAPKQRAAPLHLAASPAPGCAGGGGRELRGILSPGAITGPFCVSALSCHLHEKGCG